MSNADKTNGIKGWIGLVDKKKIRGWACQDGNTESIEVTLYIDGQKIATNKANEKRPGLVKRQKIPTIFCGYTFELNYPISSKNTIEVKAGSSEIPLNIHGKAQQALNDIEINARRNFKGQIDAITENNITGWAYEQGNVYQPIKLNILVNGEKVATVSTDTMHEKTKEHNGHPTGLCGFRYAFEKSINAGDTISIVYSNSDKELSNSPQQKGYTVPNQNRILIIGLGKSGTSILTYRIAKAFPFRPKICFEPGGVETLSDISIHSQEQDQDFLVTKSLFFPIEGIAKDCEKICELYDKVVWIVRDPRDQFISSFFYRWYHAHNPDPKLFEKAYKRILDKEANPSMPFHKVHDKIMNAQNFFTNAYGKSQEQLSQIRDKVFLLKYEDFVSNNLADLNEYLQLKIDEKVEVPKVLKRVARTKKYDNWRNWFTPEDVPFYKPILEPYLEFFGYNPEDWQLNNPDTLNSAEGSEYMIKLNTKPPDKK